MPLTYEQINEWATAYIQAQPHACLTADHPLWWAVDRFMELTDPDKAEDAWLVILQILARNPAQVVLAVLAAGPLEDLIRQWGPQFIDRIEAEAERNPQFRMLLRGVWESGNPAVCRRVAALKALHDA